MTGAHSMNVIDLFAGCGGMSLGFESAGFNVVAAFENWQPALDVYRENFDHPAIYQNLGDVPASVAKIQRFNPGVIIGGPPCQDFSTAGRQDENGGRAMLSVRFSEIIAEVRPHYFVMENVATIQNTESFRNTIHTFQNAGYGLTQKVLNASLCGVPQNRKRMFVIGGLNERDGFLDEHLEIGQAERPMTVYDYLGNSLGVEHYFRVPTNYQRRAVYSIHEPSMTIRAVDRPIPKGYKGHPRDSAPVSTVRGLTPKERSYIQTFPESFKFFGGKSDMNSMIGNAVPVNLAKYVASALSDYLGCETKNQERERVVVESR